MTNEERQKLCEWLRAQAAPDAADEIERLARQNKEYAARIYSLTQELSKWTALAIKHMDPTIEKRISELERREPW